MSQDCDAGIVYRVMTTIRNRTFTVLQKYVVTGRHGQTKSTVHGKKLFFSIAFHMFYLLLVESSGKIPEYIELDIYGRKVL